MQDRKQSPIFVKTYDLLLWLLERTAHFPKHERFRMARRLEESAFALYDLILQAGRPEKGRTRDKRRLLLQADLELDRLRLQIRLCQDLKLLSLEAELLNLRDELASHAYHPSPYRSFVVRESKRRLVSAAPFRDRVVHHALVSVIGPIFERRYPYALQCDVRQFFPSIDHALQKETRSFAPLRSAQDDRFYNRSFVHPLARNP